MCFFIMSLPVRIKVCMSDVLDYQVLSKHRESSCNFLLNKHTSLIITALNWRLDYSTCLGQLSCLPPQFFCQSAVMLVGVIVTSQPMVNMNSYILNTMQVVNYERKTMNFVNDCIFVFTLAYFHALFSRTAPSIWSVKAVYLAPYLIQVGCTPACTGCGKNTLPPKKMLRWP